MTTRTRQRGGEPQAIGAALEVPAVTVAPASTLGEVSPQTMEALVVGGDLSKLSPAQRVEVYMARCEAAGLDPRTQPFSYLNLQGKLTLYATKTATDQLVATRRLSVQISDRKHLAEVGLYEVVARVTFPDGRMVEDVGVVPIQGLRGDQAANAIMKAITKAKRRAILSSCGLGMLDETEVGTIPEARVQQPDALHVVEIVQDQQPAQQQEQAAATDNQDLLRQVAAGWRALGWTPEEAKAHLYEATRANRVRDLEAEELQAYTNTLADLLADDGASYAF